MARMTMGQPPLGRLVSQALPHLSHRVPPVSMTGRFRMVEEVLQQKCSFEEGAAPMHKAATRTGGGHAHRQATSGSDADLRAPVAKAAVNPRIDARKGIAELAANTQIDTANTVMISKVTVGAVPNHRVAYPNERCLYANDRQRTWVELKAAAQSKRGEAPTSSDTCDAAGAGTTGPPSPLFTRRTDEYERRKPRAHQQCGPPSRPCRKTHRRKTR